MKEATSCSRPFLSIACSTIEGEDLLRESRQMYLPDYWTDWLTHEHTHTQTRYTQTIQYVNIILWICLWVNSWLHTSSHERVDIVHASSFKLNKKLTYTHTQITKKNELFVQDLVIASQIEIKDSVDTVIQSRFWLYSREMQWICWEHVLISKESDNSFMSAEYSYELLESF